MKAINAVIISNFVTQRSIVTVGEVWLFKTNKKNVFLRIENEIIKRDDHNVYPRYFD